MKRMGTRFHIPTAFSRLGLPTIAASAAVFLGMIFLAGCSKEQGAKNTKNPRVIVTTPISDTVIDYQDFTGRTDAFKSVDIRGRVTGFITEAPFKEGDLVEQGKLLFQIDKRPYAADLNQAIANLNVAMADRNLAEKNLERIKKIPIPTVTPEELETFAATYEKAVANVAAMEAARDRAKLYLEYTSVTAPISGRISRRQVDPGNLVNADMTVLTSIVTEDPMYAYFDVDERTYLELLELVSTGKTARADMPKLPVMIRLANETDFKRVGSVDFVDNRVIATTGTVRMRGIFENANRVLKAGLFVRIRLPVSKPFKAIMIPDEAIQSDQERKYVWVVNAKNEVEYRSVQLGQAIQKLRVIRPPSKENEGKEGLNEGDRIVISGMQKVRNGIQVDADMQTPPPPPKMPLVQLLAEKESK